MRIAQLFAESAAGIGGVERSVYQLAAQFASRGHVVEFLIHVTTPRAGPLLCGPLRSRRFQARGAPIAPGLVTYLARHAHEYDVVHIHNYHALPVLSTLLVRPRALVFDPHYHGAGPTMARRILLRLYRPMGHLLLSAADAVVCVSTAEALLLHEHFGDRLRVRRIIPYGVDTGSIAAAVPFPVGQVVLLSASRLEPHKGIAHLIHAMPRLDPRFSLVIAGGGPEEVGLRRLVAALGLHARVQFVGVIDDATLHRWLRTAAVLVTLSRLEAYGLTVLEALAAGARVVAADIPVMREHQRSPYGSALTLVPLDADPVVIAGAISRAAAAGRFTDLACLPSWESAALATLNLYRELGAR